MGARREIEVNALIKEHEQVARYVESLYTQNEKVFGFGIGIFGLAAAYGLEKRIHEIVFVLPLLCLGLLAYVVLNYTVLRALAGYDEALTEEINHELEREVYAWSARVGPSLIARSGMWSVLSVFAVALLVGSSYVGLVDTRDAYGPTGVWLLLTLLVAMGGALGYFALRMKRMYGRGYAARSQANRWAPPTAATRTVPPTDDRQPAVSPGRR